MQPFRVLLIDDHPVVLLGLRLALDVDDRFVVCGEAATPAAARDATAALAPDLIVADLVLGGDDGAAMIRGLLAIRPLLQILVYSSCGERLHAPASIRAGARGYVSKAEGVDVVVEALGVIARGGTYLSPTARDAAIDALASGAAARSLPELSAREFEILRLIANGQDLRAIALHLGLSVKTVGTYRERLKIKLGLDTARALERAAPAAAETLGSDRYR